MSEPVRSLQVIASPRMGGAETSFMRVACALDAAGHPTLAGVRRGSELERLLEGRVALAHFSMRNYIDVSSILQIRDAAIAHRAQVVQTWASRASWLTRAPGGTLHIARLGGYYKLRYFRHADGWVVNTRGLRDWMVSKGFPPDRVEWINNFVPPLAPGDGPVRSRGDLHIPADALVVIAMGRFVGKKGFQDLVSAFARLPERIDGRPVHLLLMGDGRDLAELRSMAGSLGTRVHFTGWIEQPVAMLALGDVFVCPSRIEPLGNVVLEAWSQGLPVICTETAGGTELIRSGDTGLLCPASDVARMAAAIERVLRDSELREGLARRGLAHYLHRYSEQKTVDALLDFYRRMIRRARVRKL